MIVTPSGFSPLLVPAEHPRTLTFVFRGPELLVREEDARLPEAPVKIGRAHV